MTKPSTPPKKPKTIRADKDEFVAEDKAATHGRGVLIGKLDDPRDVFNLILRCGVAHIDSDTWLTTKKPEHMRTVGKTGPGHVDHPLTRLAQQEGREAEIRASNMCRDIGLRKAAHERSLNSQRETILRLYDAQQPWHCHVAKQVADLVGVTANHVRRTVRARKKSGPDGVATSGGRKRSI